MDRARTSKYAIGAKCHRSLPFFLVPTLALRDLRIQACLSRGIISKQRRLLVGIGRCGLVLRQSNADLSQLQGRSAQGCDTVIVALAKTATVAILVLVRSLSRLRLLLMTKITITIQALTSCLEGQHALCASRGQPLLPVVLRIGLIKRATHATKCTAMYIHACIQTLVHICLNNCRHHFQVLGSHMIL